MHVLIGTSSEAMGISIDFAFDVKFSYTREGDVINCEFKDCDADITKLELPEKTKAALEARGSGEEDLKESMKENTLPKMAEGLSEQMNNEMSKLEIKELSGKKLVLKEGENTIKLKRM